MAFSTQKDFFRVPFMNQRLEFECKKECVKLKSYESTIDDRSWALDEEKQSRFLSDLVACRTLADEYAGSGGRRPNSGKGGSGARGRSEGRGGPGNVGDRYLAEHGIPDNDSVLEVAQKTLTRLKKALHITEKALDDSNERLKTAEEENEALKKILDAKADRNLPKEYKNKVDQLRKSGKIDKPTEDDLKALGKKIDDLSKAYDVCQAEILYLKRLVDKMAKRAQFNEITTEPETCTDVPYLQERINCLNKELAILRKSEDANMGGGARQSDQSRSAAKKSTSEQEALVTDRDTIKAIIKERNSLREKAKAFKYLEKQVCELQKIANNADCVSDNLDSNLQNQSKYICELEQEMQRMQLYYDDIICKMNMNMELTKHQLMDLKDELARMCAKAQKADCLELENGQLRNELLKRESQLNDYECQYKQLMCVVEELQRKNLKNGAYNDYIENLAMVTSASLEEIMKVLRQRGDLDGNAGGTVGAADEECCKEKERLQNLVDQLTEENRKLGDRLKQEQARLSDTYKGKLHSFSCSIDRLDQDMTKTAQETSKIRKDIRASLELIKDISNVQLNNKKLDQTLKGLSSREDPKLQGPRASSVCFRAGGQPGAAKPGCVQLGAAQIGGAQPEIGRPAAGQPGAAEPGDLPSGTVQPESQTRSDQPGGGHQSVGQEAARGPEVGPQTAGDPGTGQQGVCQAGVCKPIRQESVNRVPVNDLLEDREPVKKNNYRELDHKPLVKQAMVNPESYQAGVGQASSDQQRTSGPGAASEGARCPGTGQPGVGQAGAGKLGEGQLDDGHSGTGQAGVGQQGGGQTSADRLGVGKPGVGQAGVGQPGADEQDARKPGFIQDAFGLGFGQPGLGQKGVGQPGAGQARSGQQGTGGPGACQLGAGGPGTDQQGAGGPGAGQPGVGHAGVGQPGRGQQGACGPGTGQAGVRQAGCGQQGTGGPGAGQQGAGGPGPGQTGVGQAGSGQQATGGPGAGQQGAGGPGTGQQGACGPGAGQPGVGKAGVGQPGGGQLGAGGPGAGQPVLGQQEAGGPEPGQPGACQPYAAQLGTAQPCAAELVGAQLRAGQQGTGCLGQLGAGQRGASQLGDGQLGAGQPGAGAEGQGRCSKGQSGSGQLGAGHPGGGQPGAGTEYDDGAGALGGPGAKGQGRGAKSQGAAPTAAGRRAKCAAGGKTATGGRMDRTKPQPGRAAPTAEQMDDFVTNAAPSISSCLRHGGNLEDELCTILDEFLQECNFCYCKHYKSRSRFYATCHKIVQEGLQVVSFEDLVYMHKKIFAAIDRMQPGYLLSMMMKASDESCKCCACRNVLCCTKSEAFLKEKIFKLERDILTAKEYLDMMTTASRSSSPSSKARVTFAPMCHTDAKPKIYQSPKSQCTTTKQLKKLKAHLLKMVENE